MVRIQGERGQNLVSVQLLTIQRLEINLTLNNAFQEAFPKRDLVRVNIVNDRLAVGVLNNDFKHKR